MHSSYNRHLFCLVLLLFTTGLVACEDGTEATTDAFDTDGDSSDAVEMSVAEELGLDKYKGNADPVSTTENGNETTWEFDFDDGPGCLQGDPFRTMTRDAGSDSLLIFLQGGGACWSDYCLAVTRAGTELPSSADLLDPEKESNPFKDWNVVYLPYCDGSLFVGDKDHDDDDDGEIDRYHRGLHNLTASLDVAKEQFPNPERVVLSGASAGGFGTLFGAPLVRDYYPDAELVVLDDAGVGIGKPGNNAFIEQLIDEFGANELIPEDCDDCVDNGTIVGLVDWYFERDTEIRAAVVSSWYDALISSVFLQIEPALFQTTLEAESGELQAKYPDRIKRFIYGGFAHTATLGDVSGVIGSDFTAVILPDNATDLLSNLEIQKIDEAMIGDVVLADWLATLFDTENWEDLTAPVGDPPEETPDE
jgi:hypothetical protein